MSETRKPSEDIDVEMEEVTGEPIGTPVPAPRAPQVAVVTANQAMGMPAAEQAFRGPALTPSGGIPTPAMVEAQELLAFFEREARALGADPQAARLHHEMGLLWEEAIKSQRNAAVCYQNAYKLNPRYVPNLQSARRLFAEVGNWQMVAQLLDAELAVAEDPKDKLALLQEKAVILEERLGRPDDALALLVQAQALAPTDGALLAKLEETYLARGELAALRDVQVKLAEATQDRDLKTYYLASAARLSSDRLQQPAQAAELFRKAFALHRDDPVLSSAVKGLAEREGRSDELVSALEAEAESAGPRGAPSFYRLSRVYSRLGRQEEALAALLSARRVAPVDPLILSELARVFAENERWEELADVLQARIKVIRDEAELVAMNLWLGALYEERLKREDDAIACYRAVLNVANTNAVAIASLGKLYARKGNWDGLLATYEAEVAIAEDAKQKVARIYKAAELLETKLGRDADAIARYNEILALQPGYLPAQKSLARIFERTQRWEDLVALHEQDLGSTRDRDQVIAVLSHVAMLCEEKLKDPARAVAALKRILDVAHDHLPTIRNLARLCERAGLWAELIHANELESALAGDARQVISLLHRNAEIYEEQLKDKEQAITAYQKVLALSASYLPVLKALGRLYAQTGRWSELIDMYRAEAEITSSTEQAAGLIYKTGELYEEKLQRVDDAISAYQEVLTLSPNHVQALRALSRIYRNQKAWESLVDVLRAEASGRTEPSERANTLVQVGALWEDELGRADMAIETYAEVLALSPGHVAALRGLERLYVTLDRPKDLVTVYERELQTAAEPAHKVSAYLKLAALYLSKLEEPAHAAQCYEAVLGLDASNLTALKALEQLRVQDRARRAELRSRLAQRVTDAKSAVALHLGAIQDKERAGGSALPIEEANAALELDATDRRTLGIVERLLRRSGNAKGLIEALEKRLEVTRDTDAQLALFMRIGELAERQLNDADRALKCYHAVLTAMPEYLPALRGTRRLLMQGGPNPEVLKVLQTEGRVCRDPKDAIEALLEAGRYAHQKLKDEAQARAAFQAVLERDPLEPRATRALEDLLVASGGAADIAALHLRRGQTLAASHDAAGAAEEFMGAAKVFAAQLKDGKQALAAAEQALACVPTHVAALQLRGDLCLASGNHVEAARSYLRRIEQGGDPRELAALHHRLGVLFQEQLNDPGRATAHLGAVLSVDPRNLDALERVASIHWTSRNWSGAADAYRRLIETETEPKKLASHLVSFARIADEGFQDAQTAATQLRRALDLIPGSSDIIDRLAGLYERLGNLGELVGLLEQQATSAVAAGDKPRATSLRMKAGELHVKLNDQIKAVSSYRFAVEASPDSIQARAALAETLARDPNAAAAAIEEHRNLLKLDPFRIDAYHTLYRLYAGSRQIDRAVCVGHILSFFRALNDAELASFSEAKGRVPLETNEHLNDQEMDALLHHPGARGPLSDLMRIIGDQLHKVYEPQLEAQGIGKADKLKPDHAVAKILKSVAGVFGVEKFDVYQGKRGAQITLENTDPMAVVFGPDMVKRYNAREQRFLMARAAFGLRNRIALARRLDAAQLTDLLGNAVRVAQPEFAKLGRADAEASKRLRKAMSGKAIKAIEQLLPDLSSSRASLDVGAWLQAGTLSADRAGLLLCGDPANALQLLFREDPSVSGQRVDSTDLIVAATRKRKDMAELLTFLLSDDHFKLRGRLRLGLS